MNLIGMFLVLIGIVTSGSMVVGVYSKLPQFPLSGSATLDITSGAIVVVIGLALIIFNRGPMKNRELRQYEKVSAEAVAIAEKIAVKAGIKTDAKSERKRLQNIVASEKEAAKEMRNIGCC